QHIAQAMKILEKLCLRFPQKEYALSSEERTVFPANIQQRIAQLQMIKEKAAAGTVDAIAGEKLFSEAMVMQIIPQLEAAQLSMQENGILLSHVPVQYIALITQFCDVCIDSYYMADGDVQGFGTLKKQYADAVKQFVTSLRLAVDQPANEGVLH